MNEESALNLV